MRWSDRQWSRVTSAELSRNGAIERVALGYRVLLFGVPFALLIFFLVPWVLETWFSVPVGLLAVLMVLALLITMAGATIVVRQIRGPWFKKALFVSSPLFLPIGIIPLGILMGRAAHLLIEAGYEPTSYFWLVSPDEGARHH